jgi:hypothetical protein
VGRGKPPDLSSELPSCRYHPRTTYEENCISQEDT